MKQNNNYTGSTRNTSKIREEIFEKWHKAGFLEGFDGVFNESEGCNVMNATNFIKKEMKTDFNTRQLVNGLDGIYQGVLTFMMDKFAEELLLDYEQFKSNDLGNEFDNVKPEKIIEIYLKKNFI